MKIGLITYHYSQNYGAVMQTYATCRILKEMGHEVEIINIRQLEKRKLRHLIFIPKYRNFKNFMKKFYPKQTPLIQTIKELRDIEFDYDCLMVGSDQVWNPMISLDKCLAYFLDFGKSNIKRISYASSFGISQWPQNDSVLTRNVTKALDKFDAISTREKTGQELLKKTFKKESQLVVDPTLLHENYNEITGNIEETDNIVCYLLNRTNDQIRASHFIKKELNKKTQIITSVYPILGLDWIYPPSIEDWIKYIGGAKLVITDSFHGIVFSLIYRRNFVVIAVNNGRNSRLIDLLKMVGLENRYFTSFEDIRKNNIYKTDIDYTNISLILETKSKESIAFLHNNLD